MKSANEMQENIKCRVLVNLNEVKEMTLGELLIFMRELDKGKHSKYDVPFVFRYEELAQGIQEPVIDNEWKLCNFLSYIYCVYRKIEMKMKKAGYPGILPDMIYKKQPFDKIRANLDMAKEEYRSIDGNNFLKMYPVLKKLFFCYMNYIKHSIDNKISMDEGNHLPGTVDATKSWLQRLNIWSPLRFKKAWINCMGSFIVIPCGDCRVIEILSETPKFRNLQIFIDNKTKEPYIKENSGKVSFGFINMKGAQKIDILTDFIILESRCPKKCTKHSRKWICTKCGEAVKVKSHATKDFLSCSCGSKRYEDKLFICQCSIHLLQS